LNQTREARSKAGRLVRLTVEQNTYPGAEPFYTVAYCKSSGDPQSSRYTPFLNVAEHVFRQYLDDVTDPAELVVGKPVGVERVGHDWSPATVISTPPEALERGGRREIPGHASDPLADPHKQRGFAPGLYDAQPTGAGRRGGRPQLHASRQAARAAAARAYRARRRAVTV
jgi:hypothetical protein